MTETRETKIRERRNYVIEGEDKYLLRADGSRIGPTEATECEMELWAALQTGREDALEEAAQQADRWGKTGSKCSGHDDNPCCHVRTGAAIGDAIRSLSSKKEGS